MLEESDIIFTCAVMKYCENIKTDNSGKWHTFLADGETLVQHFVGKLAGKDLGE